MQFADTLETVAPSKTSLNQEEETKKLRAQESTWIEKLRNAINKENKDFARMIIQRLSKKEYQWQLGGNQREFNHLKKKFDEVFPSKSPQQIANNELMQENKRIADFENALKNSDKKNAERLFSIFSSEDQIWLNNQNNIKFQTLEPLFYKKFPRTEFFEKEKVLPKKSVVAPQDKRAVFYTQFKKAIDAYDKKNAESIRTSIIKRGYNNGSEWQTLDRRYQSVFHGYVPLWLRRNISWLSRIRYLWSKKPNQP